MAESVPNQTCSILETQLQCQNLKNEIEILSVFDQGQMLEEGQQVQEKNFLNQFYISNFVDFQPQKPINCVSRASFLPSELGVFGTFHLG